MSDLHADTQHFLAAAKLELTSTVDSLEAAAVRGAADLIQSAERGGGRVHVTGVGKPAYVAGYTASLLSSTGTPAVVLDGTEGAHGSAGQIVNGDVVVAISNSGETGELLTTLKAVKRAGARLIAITAGAGSSLASQADVSLIAKVTDEGGPLGLAPRTSILAQILVAQVLSVELQARHSFSKADYNARHPAGDLGKKSSESP